MDIVERLREGKSAGGYWSEKEAADEIERLQLREETLSGIIDGMTARFIEAQGAVEEIERLRKENQRQKEHIMLLNSMIQTEHNIIRVVDLKEGE